MAAGAGGGGRDQPHAPIRPPHISTLHVPHVPHVLHVLQEIERYKQAFGRPGAAKALLDYYRSLVDTRTRHSMALFET